MSRFSLGDLNRTKYVVPVVPVAGSTGSIIPGIGSSQPVAGPEVYASDYTEDLADVGIAANEYDYTYFSDQNLTLGELFSNGTRLQYLAFKGTTAGGCQIVTPAQTILVEVLDSNDPTGYTLQEQYFGETVVITSYIGNAVLPQTAPPNNNTCVRLLTRKSVLVNKNCGE